MSIVIVYFANNKNKKWQLKLEYITNWRLQKDKFHQLIDQWRATTKSINFPSIQIEFVLILPDRFLLIRSIQFDRLTRPAIEFSSLNKKKTYHTSLTWSFICPVWVLPWKVPTLCQVNAMQKSIQMRKLRQLQTLSPRIWMHVTWNGHFLLLPHTVIATIRNWNHIQRNRPTANRMKSKIYEILLPKCRRSPIYCRNYKQSNQLMTKLFICCIGLWCVYKIRIWRVSIVQM